MHLPSARLAECSAGESHNKMARGAATNSSYCIAEGYQQIDRIRMNDPLDVFKRAVLEAPYPCMPSNRRVLSLFY